MKREEVREAALNSVDNNKFVILELTTGYGKTKMAIDLINHLCSKYNKELKTLILVAKVVHKQTWKDEFTKWGGLLTSNVDIQCYESFKKYTNTNYDLIVCDEMHHLSEKRLEVLQSITINYNFIGLSATIKNTLKDYFKYAYRASFIECSLIRAIESNILPEPTVYTIPLYLDTTKYIYKTKRFKKDIMTTQEGYYNNMSSLIEWYKNKYFNSRNDRIKNLWLSTAGKRLKWLSEQKELLINTLLDKLVNDKVLTFCSSIEQSERLGKYNITSKNKNSIKNLEEFNNNKIKHITAVNILNEGVNLNNCKVGIFCNLNSSEIMTKQKIGRLLRHKNPIIFIPYFVNTREEELVEKMLEEYNKESIKTLTYDNIKRGRLPK
jgi:superfamily II DNA or RNA helicase